jgi:hypothetical protein
MCQFIVVTDVSFQRIDRRVGEYPKKWMALMIISDLIKEGGRASKPSLPLLNLL